MFVLTHPVNFRCGRKPERPEKTDDFRQSVDWLFSHESVARIEPTISEMKGACFDDCATEAPSAVFWYNYNKSWHTFALFLALSSEFDLFFVSTFCFSLLSVSLDSLSWRRSALDLFWRGGSTDFKNLFDFKPAAGGLVLSRLLGSSIRAAISGDV